MKVIDLLNKIANGEEPPKLITYKNDLYELKKWDNIEETDYSCVSSGILLGDIYLTILNEEVEIIEDTPKEDKKIEKFKVIKDNSGDSVELIYDGMKLELTLLQAIILDKINEIIDKINGE